MGMFDRVLFTCPKCDAQIEVQSKAVDCTLSDISSSAVPPRIAEDIKGEEVHCKECGTTYMVVALTAPALIPMGLIARRSP